MLLEYPVKRCSKEINSYISLGLLIAALDDLAQ